MSTKELPTGISELNPCLITVAWICLPNACDLSEAQTLIAIEQLNVVSSTSSWLQYENHTKLKYYEFAVTFYTNLPKCHKKARLGPLGGDLQGTGPPVDLAIMYQ